MTKVPRPTPAELEIGDVAIYRGWAELMQTGTFPVHDTQWQYPPAAALVLQGLAKFFPRVGYQRTFFVGSPCADEGTIGLVPGVGLAEVIGELRGAVLAGEA